MELEKTTGVVNRLRSVVDDIGWAARRYHSSRGQIIARLWTIYRHTRCRPFEAHHDGLSNPALALERLAGTIPKSELLALQSRLNPASHEILANDKAVFYALCQGMGLPVPALFGVVDSSGGFAADGHPWDADSLRLALEAIDREIIVKPARGVYGQGVRAYLPTPQGFCDRTSGQVFSPECLARALRQVGRVVIQERLQNHPDITRLSGSTALQTVRIRCLVTKDGEARMGGCFFKIAVGQNIIDNLDGGRTGNFLAAVTLTDGRLCTAVGYSKNGRGIEAVARHPDTGLALEGFCVPFWAEAKALAKQASQLFLPLRTIGWDIALTKKGPVLVEGNPCWDPANLMAAVPVDGDLYAEEMAVLLNAMRREASGSGTR